MSVEVHDTSSSVDVPTRTVTYAPPPPTVVRTEQDRTTTGVMTGGASLEAIGGAGAIVLAILGLVGLFPFYMTAIATIAAGGGLFFHGAAAASRWKETRESGGGVGVEGLGGAGGIVLGILSLVGIMPMVLLPVAAIVLGAAVLLSGPVQPALDRSAAGIDVLCGAGAAVLGILALLHIGPVLMMTMVAMLAVGAGLLLSGGVLAARFGRRYRHA